MKLVFMRVCEILLMFVCLFFACLSFMIYSSFSTVPGKLKLTPIG